MTRSWPAGTHGASRRKTTKFPTAATLIGVAFLLAAPPAYSSQPLDVLGSIQSVSPQPATVTLTAKVSLRWGQEVVLRLFSARGKIMRNLRHSLPTGASQSLTMDLSGVPSGIYFLQFETLHGASLGKARKVVIVR